MGDTLAKLLITASLTTLLLVPIWHYLQYGWGARRSEILVSFTDNAIRLYCRTFCLANYEKKIKPHEAAGDAERNDDTFLQGYFRDYYDKRFGRGQYYVPAATLAVLASFLTYYAVQGLFGWLQGETNAAVIPQSSALRGEVAISAVAGAYMWVLYDLIFRAHRRDLLPAHVIWACLRLVIAIPLALALQNLFKDAAAVALAFLVGAFHRLPYEDISPPGWSAAQRHRGCG